MNEYKKCPHCGEEIKADAAKCKHCGEWLNDATEPEKKTNQGNEGMNSEDFQRNEVVADSKPVVAVSATESSPKSSKESLFKSCFWEQMTKHYCDFKGKLDRKTFWVSYLYYTLLMFFVASLSTILPFWIGNTLLFVFGLGLAFPYLGLMVRRLHDIGKGGEWILIPLLPLIGAIWLYVLLAKKGETQNHNKWTGKDTLITIALVAATIVLYAFIGLNTNSYAITSGVGSKANRFEIGKNDSEEEIKAEIEKQVLEAYNNHTIYDLETPDFKAAGDAGSEFCVEWDYYYVISDGDCSRVSDVRTEIIDGNSAKVYVTLEDLCAYENNPDTFIVTLSMIRESGGEKWLVDDVDNVKELMIECANSDWRDERGDENDDSGFSYEVDEYGNEYMIGEDGVSYYRGNVNDDEDSVDEGRNSINVEKEVVVIDGSELRLRLGPSTSSETLKWGDGSNRHPDVGERFKYLDESGDFYKIDYKGNEVWVSKQFTHIEMQ